MQVAVPAWKSTDSVDAAVLGKFNLGFAQSSKTLSFLLALLEKIPLDFAIVAPRDNVSAILFLT